MKIYRGIKPILLHVRVYQGHTLRTVCVFILDEHFGQDVGNDTDGFLVEVQVRLQLGDDVQQEGADEGRLRDDDAVLAAGVSQLPELDADAEEALAAPVIV